MSHHTLGLIVGGLIPALLFGVSNLFIKGSIQVGISLPLYLLSTGVAVLVVGLLSLLVVRETQVSSGSFALAFGSGVCWAIGIFCVTFALQRYDATVSTLTPLFNMNTLIAVLLALWIFAEWKQVQVPHLLIGSLFIIIGGIFVARA